MKTILFALFVALLMTGCEKEEFAEGQIFIVQGSGESTKLGLVKVRVFDSDAIKKTRQEAEVIFQERLNKVTRSSTWASFEQELLLTTLSQAAASSETKTDADGRFLFSPPSDEFAIVATSSRHLWAEIFKRDSIGPGGLMLSNDNLLGHSANPLLPLAGYESRFLEAVSNKPEPPKKKKVVKLIQRQQKKPLANQQTFRTTAISDITLPDFNELDVKDLSPSVNADAPSTGNAGTNNDAMKSALKGIGLSLPKTMQQRCDPKKRVARLRSGGGKEMTEAAIIRGLDWLKANQDPEGSWGGKDKDDQGNPKSTDKNAMTGMALLAFLGHCELQDSPDYGPTVQKAIHFLTSSPPDKLVGGGNTGSYSHPIRTYALCEAYTMTKIKRLEEYAKRAVIHVIKGQNENGGWAYGYGKGVSAHTDLSVTGWNVQALKAAALTGISIDGLDEAMDKAVEYVKKCQDQSGKFAYKMGGGGKPSLTGTGVLCLQIWKNAKSEEAKKGLEWIVANQAKEWKSVNVYEWYYHAQACFAATGVSGGSVFWRAWNKDFQQIVCGAQDSDGHWPTGAHYHGDSDIYRTTMTILMLEVYYRYMPSSKV